MAKACLALAATVFALFIGEVVIRLLQMAPELKPLDFAAENCVYQRSQNPILGFELKANYRNDHPDFIESYERTNAHGQRDKERPVRKTGGTRRVLLIGDSVVEGHGLAQKDTISSQWESLYSDGTTEVLNFGVSAYCTLAEIELLETKGMAFDPDVVVVVFVENDFDNFNREAFALDDAFMRPAMMTWLFRRSHLFRLASIRLDLFHFGAATDPVRWNRDAIGDNNVVEGFKRLREMADREGFQPLVAIWPRFLDDRIVDVPLVSASDPAPVAERLAAMHGLPAARLSTIFQRHEARMEGALNPRHYYTSGDGLHPSREGAAVAAAGLQELIEELEAGELAVSGAPPDESTASLVSIARSLGSAQPSYSRVYHRQGVELLKNGRFEEAVEWFRAALEEDPGHAGAHGNMGLAFEKMELPREAKHHYKKAIEIQGDFVQAHFNLARMFLAEGDTASALASLRRTIEIDPGHTDALNLLGMELGKAGRFGEARIHLMRAVRIDPGFSEAHNNLGTVFAATGELELALEHFKSAAKADPMNRGAASRLREVEQMLRDRQ